MPSIGPGFSITPVNAAAEFPRVSTLLSSLLPARLLCMVSCENAPAVQRKGNVSPAKEIQAATKAVSQGRVKVGDLGGHEERRRKRHRT